MKFENIKGEILPALEYPHEYKFENTRTILIIEKGNMDLFLLDEQKEFKYFVINRGANNIYFPITAHLKDYKIIHIVSADAVIRKTTILELKEALKDEYEKYIVQELNSWITNIYENIIEIPNLDVTKYIERQKKQSFTCTKETVLAGMFHKELKYQSMWIKIEKGNLFLMGQKTLFLDKDAEIFPISYKAHFSSPSEEVELITRSTSEVVQSDLSLTALKFFHKIIFEYMVISVQKKEKLDKKRILEKQKLEKLTLEKTINDLGTILEKEEKYSIDKHLHVLQQTFQILGHYLFIHFKFPKYLTKPEDIDHCIKDICDNSSIRFRKVKLENNWQKKDSGHLLAFTNENKPVALIRKKNRYEIIDPKKNKIDINNISEYAYMFYLPMPLGIIKKTDFLRFSLKNKKREILSFVLLGFITIFLALYVPFANALLFNRVIPLYDKTLLYQISLGLFIFALGFGIFSFTSSFVILRLKMLINTQIQASIWDKVLRFPISLFHKFTTGDLIQRIFSIANIENILSTSILNSLFFSFFSLLYVIIMFIYSWPLALLGIGIVLFSIFFNLLFILKKIKIDSNILHQKGMFESFILQVLSGIDKIRETAAENIMFTKWGQHYKNIKSNSLKSTTISNFLSTFNTMFTIFATLSIFALALFLKIHSPSFSLGNFIAFSVAFGSFFAATNNVNSIMIKTFGSIASRLKHSKVIFESPIESQENKIDPGKLIGYVEVENVHFKYEEKGPEILKGVSFQADPGEFIAIVGPSGSGKSTIIKLLLNFFFPTSGFIYYDKKIISTLDTSKIRKQLGVVLQDSNLMAGTIEENLAYGLPYDKALMEKALNISGFDEILKDLPMGLHTFISEGGKNLSGGQKQQLLIARAILREPKILIFDEATNALDNRTQEKITKSVEKLKMTRIAIAHRLSTIAEADKIYVLYNGTIADQGTFNELASKKGLFSSWLAKQRL